MYDKHLKMKRGAWRKAVLEKDFFQWDISLHFQLFVIRYAFSLIVSTVCI